MRLWVITYDIANDKRRRNLAKCLGKQLHRVQESVFEGWLNAQEINTLMAEIRPTLDFATDKLRAYPLAVRQEKNYQTYGQQHTTPRNTDYWVIG